MGDDQLTVIEDIVAYQTVEKFGQFLAERFSNFGDQGVDFCQGIRQAVRRVGLGVPLTQGSR